MEWTRFGRLDTRDFAPADRYLEDTGADAQLRSVLARDPRNRDSFCSSWKGATQAPIPSRLSQLVQLGRLDWCASATAAAVERHPRERRRVCHGSA